MREILFKAKRKDNGEWVEGYVVFCNGKINPGQTYITPTVSGIIALENWEGIRLGPFVEVDHETICQYTGLTDKNGRKVFDGDLVKCLYEDIVNGDYISEIHTCDMENYYCMLRIISAYEIEVIGNIHDEED